MCGLGRICMGGVLSLLELGLQAVVSLLMEALGNSLWFSERNVRNERKGMRTSVSPESPVRLPYTPLLFISLKYALKAGPAKSPGRVSNRHHTAGTWAIGRTFWMYRGGVGWGRSSSLSILQQSRLRHWADVLAMKMKQE